MRPASQRPVVPLIPREPSPNRPLPRFMSGLDLSPSPNILYAGTNPPIAFQPVDGHIRGDLHLSVGTRKRVVKDAGVPEVAHGKAVQPLQWTRTL
jgi:hypothetical protein